MSRCYERSSMLIANGPIGELTVWVDEPGAATVIAAPYCPGRSSIGRPLSETIKNGGA